MKHNKTFTKSEIAEIKKLINEKVKSGTVEQKGVRDKIRRIYGFYWSDFSNTKPGYTVEHLQNLIDTKKLKLFRIFDFVALYLYRCLLCYGKGHINRSTYYKGGHMLTLHIIQSFFLYLTKRK